MRVLNLFAVLFFVVGTSYYCSASVFDESATNSTGQTLYMSVTNGTPFTYFRESWRINNVGFNPNYVSANQKSLWSGFDTGFALAGYFYTGTLSLNNTHFVVNFVYNQNRAKSNNYVRYDKDNIPIGTSYNGQITPVSIGVMGKVEVTWFSFSGLFANFIY